MKTPILYRRVLMLTSGEGFLLLCARVALILDHVEDVSINGLSVQGNHEAESVLRFIDSKQALITATRVLTPAAVFLQLEGTGNEGITVDGGDLSKAASLVAFKNGAAKKAVRLRT